MPAVTNIPGLPHATALNGTEQFWAVQNGLDVLVTATQIVALTGGGGGGGFGNLQPAFGVVIANGILAPLVTTTGVAGQVLTSNGAGIAPTYQPTSSGTVAGGGTGLNILNPVGGLLVANGANPINITTAGTAGQVLTSNGTGNAPTFQAPSSSSGTVPNGGTGQSTLTAHAVLLGEGVSPVNFAAPAAVGTLLTSNGATFDPTFQVLPTITVPGGGTGQTSLLSHGLLVGAGPAAVVSVSPGTSGQVLVSNGGAADPTFQNLPTIAVGSGGTGATTLTIHGVVIGQGTSAVHVTTAGTAGQVLTSGGASADPTFQAIPTPNIDVAHGGTGVATLTNHGVVIGQGTSAVHITGTGTAGQVLTSNGASADPTFQSGTATYPPLPVPDFQTFLQAAFTAGNGVNWIWGNVLLNAPVVINMPSNNNNFVINLNGAIISPSNTYSVNTAVDMITFTVPDTAPSTNIQNFKLMNGVFFGINPSAVVACRNGVIISCHLNASGIYNSGITNCHFAACGRSGCQLYGSVFEFDVLSCGGRDNQFAGFELRNPNASGGGIISSINFFGGDYRGNGTGGGGNGYGIASTAETTFQEASGFHVFGTNFIVNASAGISAVSGVRQVNGSHFENNCSNNGGETTGAVWVPGGTATLEMCDAAHSTGNGQTNALDIAGPGLASWSFVRFTYSFDENIGTAEPVAKISGGAGTLWLSSELGLADIDTSGAGGNWSIRSVTTTANTV